VVREKEEQSPSKITGLLEKCRKFVVQETTAILGTFKKQNRNSEQ